MFAGQVPLAYLKKSSPGFTLGVARCESTPQKPMAAGGRAVVVMNWPASGATGNSATDDARPWRDE